MTEPTTPRRQEETADIDAVGRSVDSKRGRKLVTGNGEFADDITLPGMRYAKFVRSDRAHARIRSIDTSAAEATPGVELVWTAEEFDPYVYPFAHPSVDPPDERAVASDRVRYHGDEVAVVVATDRQTAEDAIAEVSVVYEDIEPVLTPEAALAEDAPLVHPELDANPESEVEGNRLAEFDIGTGDVEDAFERADVVVEDTFYHNKTCAHPLEPHGCVAQYNPGAERLTVHSSHQAPHILKESLGEALVHVDQNDITCKMPDIGGGFGHKLELFSHELCASALAYATGHPINFVLDRHEEFKASRGRNEETIDGRLALSAEGDILGWTAELTQDTGAYGSYGKPVAFGSAMCSAGPYLIPNQQLHCEVVYTNKMPTTAHRGYGDPQFALARERLIDMAAEALGMDPVEIRMRNMPSSDQFPVETPKGLRWESGDPRECLRQVQARIDGSAGTRAEAEDETLHGVGYGMIMRRCGNRISGAEKQHQDIANLDVEEAIVKMGPDGTVDVLCGITSIGQGTETGLCQVVADVLGVPVADVTPTVGSTDLTPNGMGVWADRGMIMGGTAAARAAEELKTTLQKLAGPFLDVDPSAVELSGNVARERDNPSNSKPIPELAHSATYGSAEMRPPEYETGVSLVGRAKFESRPTEAQLDLDTGYGDISHSYTFGALAFAVAVDTTTGEVTVTDVAFAEDAGTIINPDMVEGQIQGGIVQGLGEALYENYHYDDEGLLTNGSMIEYHLPTAADVPLVGSDDIHEIETPSPNTAHGQKGVGESSIAVTAATVANAVTDATGIPANKLPLSAQKMLPKLVEHGLRTL
ncbi:xanthine dehydrogenase family protein molybdopterin-binding subunit [Salinigranum sp. GCM10025319]|uniref:xanthine dehydrogenase family protein molybdopterin-binding subunit n=1 Tax=Salinigranum sp. GCM10025319 TaxID=3252687 RepID=UPI00361A1843